MIKRSYHTVERNPESLGEFSRSDFTPSGRTDIWISGKTVTKAIEEEELVQRVETPASISHDMPREEQGSISMRL